MRSLAPLFALAFAVSAPALATEVVPVAPFRSVELRGGGDVVVVPGPVQRVAILEGSSQFTKFRMEPEGELKIDTCDDRCPQHYRLRIEIQSPHVPAVAVRGGGRIRAATGFSAQDQVAAAISGGGTIDLGAVQASSAAASVNGGGGIVVRARTSLAASIHGGGEVRYYGNPAVVSGVHGGGIVRPIG